MSLYKRALGLALACSAFLAQAVPLSTTGDSDYAGQPVTVVLSEPNPSGLLGLTVNIAYNPNILTFISGVAGDISAGASVIGLDSLFLDTTDPNLYVFNGVSLAYLAQVTDGAGGSILELQFSINAGAAPGTTTTVDFSCFDYGPGVGCADYAFDPVSATVTVLRRPASIPLPGTLPLLALGLGALVWARRRSV